MLQNIIHRVCAIETPLFCLLLLAISETQGCTCIVYPKRFCQYSVANGSVQGHVYPACSNISKNSYKIHLDAQIDQSAQIYRFFLKRGSDCFKNNTLSKETIVYTCRQASGLISPVTSFRTRLRSQKIGFPQAIALLLVLGTCASCDPDTLQIFVDGQRGRDELSCINDGNTERPCRTLEYITAQTANITRPLRIFIQTSRSSYIWFPLGIWEGVWKTCSACEYHVRQVVLVVVYTVVGCCGGCHALCKSLEQHDCSQQVQVYSLKYFSLNSHMCSTVELTVSSTLIQDQSIQYNTSKIQSHSL